MIEDATVLAAVDGKTALARSVIDFVHGHPELGHEEHQCASHLVEVLGDAGFETDLGAGGMDTAFRAVLTGSRPGRTVGIVALYDAVPAVAAMARSARPTPAATGRSQARSWPPRRRSPISVPTSPARSS